MGQKGTTDIDNKPSPPSITTESVKWAYKLLLDRDPENTQVLTQIAKEFSNSRLLRQHFLDTEEYLSNNPQDATIEKIRIKRNQPLQVELIDDPALLDEFFSHIKSTWLRLGEYEPHWSVLSDNKYTQNELADNLDDFYLSGQREAMEIDHILDRNGLKVSKNGICLEYGCGVGRVTRWLADRYASVYGFDISNSHLKHACEYLTKAGHDEVQLIQVDSKEALKQMPQVDLFYTRIVLQHNPPPIIELLLSMLLQTLKPGGTGIFQVPTDSLNYKFVVAPYLESLKRRGDSHGIEVHLLPQARVFELILNAGCLPIEVFEDNCAGPGFISQTFIVQRTL